LKKQRGSWNKQDYCLRQQGERALPAYRHYRLDGAGNISNAEWFEAADDEQAVRRVRERKLPVASEVWNGNRRVAKIDAAPAD
jgi:hypothetical protein